MASRKLLAPGAVFKIVNPDPFHGHVEADTLFGGGGPVGPSPTTTLGGIRIDILRPGSSRPIRTLNTEDFTTSSDPNINEAPKNRLRFQVPENLAGPGWRCRFTNISQEASNCRAQIQYPDEEVTLAETRISRRLLNRTFRQLFIALGLQVFANSGVGLVRVNDEIAHLTDGALSEIEFDIPEPIFTDVNRVRMDSLSVTAGRQAQTNLPKVVMSIGFDVDVNVGKLEFFGVDAGALMAIRRIDINLNFVLRPSQRTAIPNVIVPDVAGNVILPDVSAEVSIVGAQNPTVRIPVSVDQFCNVSFGLFDSFNLAQLEDLIECVLLKSVWSDVDVRTAISQYLTEGMMALAERSHVFWGITADNDDYIVQHFRRPRPSLDDHQQQHQGADDQVVDGGTSSGQGSGVNTGSGTTLGGGASTTANSGTTLGGNIGATTSPGTVGAAATSSTASSGTTVAAAGSGPGSSTLPAGGITDPTLANLDKIEHIVVLMMENRSFDHMLGYLKVRGGRNDIDGLTGNESNLNPITGNRVTAQPLRNTIFRFSPHHEHDHVLAQVADGTMEGFLPDFMGRFSSVDPRSRHGFLHRREIAGI